MSDKRGNLSVGTGAEPSRAPRPLRVVIADDDRDTVLMLMMVLREEGHEVRGVYRGSDVLRSISEFDADAILLDINLPDADGYQLARAIRDTRRRPPLLIGISGVYMKGSDKVLAELVGFDHYLTKPYEPSDVVKLLAPLRTQEPR